MLRQTTSALGMRSRASVPRSCAWTPSHRSPPMQRMSCAIPATPQRDALLCGCRSSSSKRPTRRVPRLHKVTGSWQRLPNTCRPDEPTKSLAIATALCQRVRVARRDLRLEHALAVLDGRDAVANLVTPIHPIPSAAPTAPGSASATTMSPTTPPIHPIPSAAPTAPGSASDDNYPDDDYPDDNYLRSALLDHHLIHHLVHDNHYPNPGTAPTAPGPTTPATAYPSTKGIPPRTSKKTKNHIQRMTVDGEV